MSGYEKKKKVEKNEVGRKVMEEHEGGRGEGQARKKGRDVREKLSKEQQGKASKGEGEN